MPRKASIKARETLGLLTKQAKREEEEDGTGDISGLEESEDEYVVPKKKATKRILQEDAYDSDEDDGGSASSRKKKFRKSLEQEEGTPRRRPGPKSKTRSTPLTPLVKKDPGLSLSPEKVLVRFRKWVNPHTYSCEICDNYRSNVIGELSKHLKDYHKIGMEQYSEIYGVDETIHTCLSCGTKVTQTGESLESHFVSKHPDTTLKDYFSTTILPVLPATFGEDEAKGEEARTRQEEKKTIKSEANKESSLQLSLDLLEEDDSPRAADASDDDTDSGLVSSTSTPMHDFCKLCGECVKQSIESIKEHFETVHVTDKDRELQKWATKCLYVPCKLCSHKATSLQDVKKHVAQKHFMDVSEYVSAHGSILDKVVYHACLVCSVAVLHDQGKLNKHLADKCKKKMTLAAYYHDKVVPSGGARPGGGKSNAGRRESNPVDPDVQQKYVKWLYQCEWECNKCQQQFNQYCQLKFHLKSDHQASMPFMKKGMETHPLAKKAVLHTCKICDKKIQHDNEYLGPHFSKEHEMGGLEYFGKYLIDPDSGELIQ